MMRWLATAALALCVGVSVADPVPPVGATIHLRTCELDDGPAVVGLRLDLGERYAPSHPFAAAVLARMLPVVIQQHNGLIDARERLTVHQVARDYRQALRAWGVQAYMLDAVHPEGSRQGIMVTVCDRWRSYYGVALLL